MRNSFPTTDHVTDISENGEQARASSKAIQPKAKIAIRAFLKKRRPDNLNGKTTKGANRGS